MPKINQNGYEGRSATATVAGIVKLSEVGGNVPQATTSIAGKAALATQGEVNTGTNNTKIVTPLTLKTNLTTPPAIGGTTPAAGAFTTLSATGAITGGSTIASTTTITAGTTLTATLGAITATNGNIVRGTAGNKDIYSSVASTTTAGANSAGTVTLVGGTATVSTTAITSSSIVRLTRQGVGATGAAALGMLSKGTVVNGTSFVINAWSAADATALAATDVSSIGWEIVN